MIDLRRSDLPAAAVIAALDLASHPEGGHYRETWRDDPANGGRGNSTAILFLLGVGELSAWNRVDADELWCWQAGAPLVLTTSPTGQDAIARKIGPDLGLGEFPHAMVPRGHWQTATSLGAWSLACCVVAPAFRFAGFEMAPGDWRPTPRAAGATTP